LLHNRTLALSLDDQHEHNKEERDEKMVMITMKTDDDQHEHPDSRMRKPVSHHERRKILDGNI
jgi:hypothetical protein